MAGESVKEILSKNIKLIRNLLKMSQAKLARDSFLSVEEIVRIENRKITPKVDTVNMIADAFNIPVKLLFEEQFSEILLYLEQHGETH